MHHLMLAAGEADLQELYKSAPGLLHSYDGSNPGAACALLQVTVHLSNPCTTAFFECPMSSMLPAMAAVMGGLFAARAADVSGPSRATAC